MAILIDTSALLAHVSAKDKNHAIASRIMTSAVLSELFYMTTIRLNYAHAIAIFAVTRTGFNIEQLSELDMVNMQAIMTKYQDVELDYTDTSIMAVAERLNITRIFTFDRRDFSIYRPNHCDHFELIP